MDNWFGRNLKYLRTKRGVDQARIARLTHKSVSTVSEWERGKYTPKAGVLADVAAFFGVKLDDMVKRDLSITSGPKLGITFSHSYTYAPAGISAGALTRIDGIANEDMESIRIPDAIMGAYAGDTDLIAMHINGESMNHTIPDGSLIVVKAYDDISELRDGDIVVFEQDGDYAVKYFYRDDRQHIITFVPDSDNKSFKPINFREEDLYDAVQIIGKVVVYTVVL